MMHMYSDVLTRQTIIEFWGASTKHPDSTIEVKHDNPIGWMPLQDLAQALFLAASEKIFAHHAKQCALKGLEILDVREELWEKNQDDDLYSKLYVNKHEG